MHGGDENAGLLITVLDSAGVETMVGLMMMIGGIGGGGGGGGGGGRSTNTITIQMSQ